MSYRQSIHPNSFFLISFVFAFFSIAGALYGQTPVIAGVGNAASGAAGIAPGEVISIYGSNLSTSAGGSCTTSTTAPTNCLGTQVFLNGNPIPLIFSAPGQINAVVPFGFAGSSGSMLVSTTGGQSAPFVVNASPASPAIISGSGGFGAFYSAGNALYTTSNPVSPGGTVVSYAYGLGITNPIPVDGATAGCSPICRPAAAVSVTVGGVPAQVLFAGLIEQVGLYQINYTVPAGLLGNQPVVITVDGITSPGLLLPISPGSPGSVSIASSANLGTWPLGEVQIGLSASGGNGSYAWSLVSGNLPPGLALRTDLPSYVTSGGPTGLIGVANTPGTYNFTLQVTSGGSAPVQQAFNMKVTPLTLMDGNFGGNLGGQLPDAYLGTAYQGSGYQLTATRNGSPVAIACTGTAPAGMSLSAGGRLSGIPTTAGTNSFTVTWNDGTDSVSEALRLPVYVVQITSPGVLPNATRNVAYNFTLAASGGTGPYTYTAGGLPPGLSLSGGVISGTPTGGQGKSGFTVTATDSQSHSYTKGMSIDVVGSPEAIPQITPYGDLWDCTIGMACSRGIGVNGGGTGPFTWNVSGLPPGLSIRYGSGNTLPGINAGDLEIWGATTALGSYNVTVAATDANNVTVTQVFPLRVSALFVDTGLSNGTVGTAYANTFRILGGTGPYTVTTAPSDAIPAGLPDGLLLGGIAVTGIPLEGGQFYPLFLATDAASPADTLSFSQPAYFAGVAGSSTVINTYAAQYVSEGQNYTLQLNACCASTYTWTQPAGSLPPGIGLSSAGVLSGSSATAGTYSFLVQATQVGNAANYGTRQITIVITPLSVTTGTNLPFATMGTAYNQTLSATGGSGPITWTLAPGNYLPPGLSLNSATGAITGSPTTLGAFAFLVDLSDTGGHTSAALFSLSVYAPGTNPPVTIGNSASLGTFSIGEIQYALQASGGNNSYSWSIVSGTLPTGLSLRTDVPSYFTAGQSAGLIGVATAPVPSSFTLKVTSGNQTATQAFTVKISALTAMENTNFRLPEAFVNQSPQYSYTLTALNGAGAVTFAAVSGLPPGIALSSAGVLSGTPTTAGFYTVRFTLNDGVDTVNDAVTLNVNVVQVTSPGLLPSAIQGASYSYTVAASGGTSPYTFTTQPLPAGLTMSSAGQITGTVTAGGGRYNFTVTATDSASHATSKALAIVVIGVPPTQPDLVPYGTNDGWDDCSVGITCTRGIGNYSGGTPPFSYAVTGLPAGMTYSTVTGASRFGASPDVEIWGTAKTAGKYPISVTLNDVNGLSVTQNLTLAISNLYVDPGDYLPGGAINVAYGKTLRVLGGTPAAATPLYGAGVSALLAPPNYVALPAGLTLGGLTVSGTPEENGSFSPQFKFSDSASNTLTNTQAFFIAGAGAAPVTINQAYAQTYNLGTTPVGVNYSIQLSASGASSYTWSQPGGNLPPGITLGAAGLLSGTPTTAGTYVFLVQSTNASTSSDFGVRQFQLVVTPLSLTPASLPFGTVNVAYNQTLAVTGATGAVMWTSPAGSSPLPPGLTLSPGGAIGGTPTVIGQYVFSVLASDSAAPNASIYLKQYTLQIYPPTGPPLFLGTGPNLNYSVGSFATSFAATGGVPPYHFSFSPGASVPPGSRVQDGPPLPTNFGAATGGLVGVWTAPGTYATSIRVADSNGLTYDRGLNITVSSLQIMTQTNLPKGTVNVAYQANVSFTGNGGSNYSWTATGLPAGMSLTAAGVLSGTPTVASSFFPVVTLTDTGNHATISLTTSLIVDPYAISTGAELPLATLNTAYSQAFSAPGCGTGCTWNISGGAIPTSMTFSSAGVLSGTPTATYNSSFTVQVSGSNGTVQKQFGLIVLNPTAALTISTASPVAQSTFGNLYALFLNAAGGSPPYSWVVTDPQDLPQGVSIQGPGETLAYNFTPGGIYLWGRPLQLGTFNYTLKVTDNAGNTASKAISWTITPLNFNYTTLPISGTTLVYNTAYSQALLVFGGSGTYSTWAVASGSALPPGLTLNSSSGVVSGTPSNTGSFTTAIQVTDSASNTMTQTITFNVAGPTGVTLGLGAASNLGTFGQGSEAVINLNPSGGTPPYSFNLVSGTAPKGCTLESGNTLLANAVGSYDLVCLPQDTGIFTFTLMVQDSATPPNIGVKTLTMTITPFTLAIPTALANGSVGTPYSQSLLIWDNTATPAISLGNGSSFPPGLSVVGGVLTGTPTAAGSYSFALTVTDSSNLTANYTFSLTVSTIAISDPQELPQQAIINVPYTYTFTATGGGSSKTWSATGLPAGFSMSSGGTLSGTATVAFRNRIAVTVTDGSSTLTRAFTLVGRANSPTVLNYSLGSTVLPDAIVGQSYAFTLQPDGGVPPYTWSVTAGSTLPPGLNLYHGTTVLSSAVAPGGAQLLGAPSTGGQFSFSLTVTDSAGATAARAFSLNAASSMGIFPGGLMTPILNQPYSQQLPIAGGTPPYTVTYSPLGINTEMLPLGLSASATGLISGTPTTTGNFGFYAKVVDSASPPNTFTTSYSYSANNSNGLRVTTAIPFDSPVGVYDSLALATNGSSTYTWSLPSGASSLPPGVSLNGSLIGGAPSTPGTYKFTVQATDNSNSANVTTRTYSWIVSPMQVLSELVKYLPAAHVNTAYSFQLKVAGGARPLQFTEDPLYPLPAGITLSATGLLSGTPTVTGQFLLYQHITDNAGLTRKAPGVNLSVVAAGNPVPLWVDPSGAIHNVTVGVPFFEYLDSLLEMSGTPPYVWAVAPSSSLPPGMELLSGTGNVISMLGGAAITPGTYPVNLTVTDSAGQTGYYSCTFNVYAGLYATNIPLPSGMVGTAYSQSLGIGGGMPPVTVQSNADMPPGLTLSSTGVLSGTPQYAGLFSINYTVTDSSTPTPTSISRTDRIVIDQNGQAPGMTVSPSAVQLAYAVNGGAPSPTPISIGATTGNHPFTASINGIPGATLSVASGTTPMALNINLNPTGVALGTYTGAVEISSPETAYPVDWIPVTLSVLPPPALSIAKKHVGNFTQGQIGATYTVTVSNGANLAPTSGTVTVTETIPAGLTLVSMSGNGWTCPGTAANNCTRTDSLAGGMSYPDITVTVNVGSAGMVTNQVSVSGGGAAASANAQDQTTISSFSACDVNQDGSTNVSDVQNIIGQALGKAPAMSDVNGDGKVNVQDVQIVMDALIFSSCRVI